MTIKVVLSASIALALCAGPALAQDGGRARFGAIMDSVFGAGNWRMTGGYRTPARENELRAQGALTVAPGALSPHSTGRPDAPGAYDVVVNGLTPSQAAAKLRAAGAPFRKMSPKGAHGTQGPHLHLEPYSFDLKGPGPKAPPILWRVADPTPAEEAMASLRAEALRQDGEAQLRLGQAYAQGRGAARDLVAAYVWVSRAAANEAAAPATRHEANQMLGGVAAKMNADELAYAQRLADGQAAGGASCGAGASSGGVVLLVGGQRASSATGAAAAQGPCPRLALAPGPRPALPSASRATDSQAAP